MDEPALHGVPQGEVDKLISILREDRYTVIGPRLREEVIVLDELTCSAELPVGWTDRQSP